MMSSGSGKTSETISDQPDAARKLKTQAELNCSELEKTEQNEKYSCFLGEFETRIYWGNLFYLVTLHVLTLYGLFIKFPPWMYIWEYIAYIFLVGGLSVFGGTAGVHRYWTHRSFKAKLPLKVILLFCWSLTGANNVLEWTRDHRLHHKYSDTDADPHNAKRGFWFSHCGWLCMKRHPEVLRKGKTIDVSDIMSDPLVAFHVRHWIWFKIMICFVIPTIIPPLVFGRDWGAAIWINCIIRYCLMAHFAWSVNSFAHIWGNKPFNKNIQPTENKIVSVFVLGEGWHNYHHSFPCDYRASELGTPFNVTALWLDMFAKIGWAYDLKTASPELVETFVETKGDGSHITKMEVTKNETTSHIISGQLKPNKDLKADVDLNYSELEKTEQYKKYTCILGEFETPIYWGNLFYLVTLHALTIYGLFKYPVWIYGWEYFAYVFLVGGVSIFGVAAGVHRYWTHKSFKAKLPLKIILLFCYSLAGLNSVLDWARDHRTHHKYSDTIADPHNAKRGFWFSHLGWFCMKKHPEVLRRGKAIDCSDIMSDPLVAFHVRYWIWFKILICFVLPSIVPPLVFGRSWGAAIWINCVIRYCLMLNVASSVNSFAHIWGNKPFDKNIQPSENKLATVLTLGEGWHNYHHSFPWDYRAAEVGTPFNITTVWLNIFAMIGWAYDLKTTSPELVASFVKLRGNGSHKSLKQY